jgi:hypothetical protein
VTRTLLGKFVLCFWFFFSLLSFLVIPHLEGRGKSARHLRRRCCSVSFGFVFV